MLSLRKHAHGKLALGVIVACGDGGSDDSSLIPDADQNTPPTIAESYDARESVAPADHAGLSRIRPSRSVSSLDVAPATPA